MKMLLRAKKAFWSDGINHDGYTVYDPKYSLKSEILYEAEDYSGTCLEKSKFAGTKKKKNDHNCFAQGFMRKSRSRKVITELSKVENLTTIVID